MIRPPIAPGIEQSNHLIRPRLDGSDIAPLVPITDHTGVGEVVEGGRTCVFPTDNVVNLVGEAGVVLVDKAILTTLTRTLGNLCS
jgi:hypothetical protein